MTALLFCQTLAIMSIEEVYMFFFFDYFMINV